MVLEFVVPRSEPKKEVTEEMISLIPSMMFVLLSGFVSTGTSVDRVVLLCEDVCVEVLSDDVVELVVGELVVGFVLEEVFVCEFVLVGEVEEVFVDAAEDVLEVVSVVVFVVVLDVLVPTSVALEVLVDVISVALEEVVPPEELLEVSVVPVMVPVPPVVLNEPPVVWMPSPLDGSARNGDASLNNVLP
jgi:hypothetical protein